MIVVEEGAEELNGSRSPPGSTLSPVFLRWRVGEEQFLPECKKPPCTDHLGVMSPALVCEEVEGAITLSSGDSHAGKHADAFDEHVFG